MKVQYRTILNSEYSGVWQKCTGQHSTMQSMMNGHGEKGHYISVASRVHKVIMKSWWKSMHAYKKKYVGYTKTAYSQTQETAELPHTS